MSRAYNSSCRCWRKNGSRISSTITSRTCSMWRWKNLRLRLNLASSTNKTTSIKITYNSIIFSKCSRTTIKIIQIINTFEHSSKPRTISKSQHTIKVQFAIMIILSSKKTKNMNSNLNNIDKHNIISRCREILLWMNQYQKWRMMPNNHSQSPRPLSLISWSRRRLRIKRRVSSKNQWTRAKIMRKSWNLWRKLQSITSSWKYMMKKHFLCSAIHKNFPLIIVIDSVISIRPNSQQERRKNKK